MKKFELLGRSLSRTEMKKIMGEEIILRKDVLLMVWNAIEKEVQCILAPRIKMAMSTNVAVGIAVTTICVIESIFLSSRLSRTIWTL